MDDTWRDKIVLTVDECADALRISRNLAYQLVREGALPHLRLGKRIIVPRQALERMLAKAGEPSEP